jgi:hypothetical protein
MSDARPFGFVGYDEAGRFEHYCEVCNAEASFGFGVSLRAGELGRWFCARHKPDDTFNPRHEEWAWDLLCYDGDGIILSPPTGPSDDLAFG